MKSKNLIHEINLISKLFDVGNFVFEKKLKSQSAQNPSSLYIFCDPTGRKYFVKLVQFTSKREFVYKHLKKEAELLKMFAGLGGRCKSKIYFASQVRFKQQGNSLVLITKYIRADELEKFPKNIKIVFLGNVLDYLENLTLILTKKEVALLPKKSNLFIFGVFHYYFFTFIFKNPRQVLRALQFLTVFYQSIFNSGQIFRTKYTVSHRDLHSKNILVKGKKTYLIDLDNCAMCPVNNDLAMMPGYFYKELDKSYILNFITNRLGSVFENKRFLYLLVFYFFVKQKTESKLSYFYIESNEYANFINSLIEGLKIV
ncbi:phosphotransferase [Patescibacteria group bacterium]|nr:phosphotransferase [Patescibacteria group bacterium]